MTGPAGYLATPLPKKLGIKPSAEVFISGAPENYVQLVSPLREGVKLVLRNALGDMKPDAAIWVSWPKKAAKVPTDITEDTIRERGAAHGARGHQGLRWTRRGPV